MPKIGRNIYKRKDGRWEGRYLKGRDSNGKIIYGYVYSKTYTEIKQRLMVLNIEELTSVSASVSAPVPVPVSVPTPAPAPAPIPVPTPAPAPVPSVAIVIPKKNHLTFADVVKQWLSITSLKVKTSTYAGYTTMLQLHILPTLGEHKIQSLTAVDISDFATNKLKNGRIDGKGGLSPKTVRDILSIIKSIMDFAYNENFINNGFAITYPKQQPQTIRVLSRQEQAVLEGVLTNNMDIYKLGILLCLYTGLRIGEVCALLWQDISKDFDTLSVRQTLQRIKNVNDSENKTKILVDIPKSLRSVRKIPIPKFLKPHLRMFVRESCAYFLGSENIVFTEPRTMQNHFAKSVNEAKILNANYHSLRHTFATRCIEAGVDVKSLSEMLGHANINITLNRYVHSSFDQKREGMNKLEKYVGL